MAKQFDVLADKVFTHPITRVEGLTKGGHPVFMLVYDDLGMTKRQKGMRDRFLKQGCFKGRGW